MAALVATGAILAGCSKSEMEEPVTDLSTIIANYTAADGETLYGTLAGNYKIAIAAGATVTLKDVTIDGSGNYAGKGILSGLSRYLCATI